MCILHHTEKKKTKYSKQLKGFIPKCDISVTGTDVKCKIISQIIVSTTTKLYINIYLIIEKYIFFI